VTQEDKDAILSKRDRLIDDLLNQIITREEAADKIRDLVSETILRMGVE